ATPRNKNRYITAFLIVAGWVAGLIVFMANNSKEGFAVFVTGIPCIAILVFAHLRYLIPIAGIKRYNSAGYLFRTIPVVFVLSLIAGATCAGITGSRDGAAITMAWMLFAFVIVIPMCWYLAKNKDEKEVLQYALGS